MILLNNFKMNTLEVGALVTYKETFDGSTMLDIIKNGKTKDPIIKKAIQKTLEDKGLLNDERFLRDGKFLETYTDIIAFTILKLNRYIHVIESKMANFNDVDSATRADTDLENSLYGYIRKDLDGNTDIHIEKIHELAYQKTKDQISLNLRMESGDLLFENDEYSIQGNTMEMALKKHIYDLLENNVEEFIQYKDDKFFINKNSEFFLNHYGNYTKLSENLEISNETLYIEDTAFSIEVLKEYGLKILKEKIIPKDRLKNEINQFKESESFKFVHDKISVDDVFKRIKKELKYNDDANYHYKFAVDILEMPSKFQKSLDNLTGRAYKSIHNYLTRILSLDDTVEKFIIVSNYFTSFKKNTDKSALNSGDYKKKEIFDELQNLLETKNISGYILSEAKNSNVPYFDNIQIKTKKSFHDRYIIIKKKDDMDCISITAELDNFDWVDSKDKKDIKLRDTKLLHIDEDELPKTIREGLENIR